jgi:hypothetical protein
MFRRIVLGIFLLFAAVSCHPEKAAAFHQDKEFLRLPVDSILTWVNLLPLLHGHYPVSSLLRSSAPRVGASVLSASWVIHLCLSPTRFSSSVRKPG